MTREQIIWNFVIAFAVGLFLIVVGAVLQPLLKRLWEWMNRPSPLNPQTKGQLVTSLALAENELTRLNYLSTHTKDLFLLLMQMVMVALVCLAAAFGLFVLGILVLKVLPQTPSLFLLQMIVALLLLIAAVVCAVGVSEAGRLSDKRIDASKKRIQKIIDDANNKLKQENV